MELTDFYFKYISIDNYEMILEETRQYVLSEVKKNPKEGFSLLKDTSKFIQHCPLISKWVSDQNLKISKVAVHILTSNKIGFLHTDFYSDGSKLALNLDMHNCAGTETKMYSISSPGKQSLTDSGSLSYTVFDPSDPTCKEVASFDLKDPVLFNVSKPHRVFNLKDTNRVSLSLRFVNHPIHLI